MHSVSDLNLALACVDAGIVPSFIPSAYSSFEQFAQDYIKFNELTNFAQCVITLEYELLNSLEYVNLLHAKSVIIEVIGDIVDIESVKNSNFTICPKTISRNYLKTLAPHITSVIIKGNKAAGRCLDGIDLISMVSEIKTNYPWINIIASGGISTKEDIQDLLAAGASAVSIGTMFALCKESSMKPELKEKLINYNSSDISRVETGANQRGIIFSTVNSPDYNNTTGLQRGLVTGSSGHIYLGNAIDNIDSIKSLREIVKGLVD